MPTSISAKIEKIRAQLSDRFFEFKPYIGEIEFENGKLRFFYGTPQAVDWYAPLQQHTRVEFEWMANRIGGAPQRIIDAGAYHGLYTLVMAQAAAPGSTIVAVDPVASNCALIEVNLLLNGLEARIEPCAVSRRQGTVQLSGGSCGHIVAQGSLSCPARPLPDFLADATIAKVDIEGEEFEIFPEQIDAMPTVHTWNVEIHPGNGRNPRLLLDAFASRGFDLLWVNRTRCEVEPYPMQQPWTERTSVIAIR